MSKLYIRTLEGRIMSDGLMLEHIQKTRSDVTWIKNENGSISYDTNLSDHASIDAAITSFDETAANTLDAVKLNIKDGERIRKELIKDIKAEVGAKLYEDLATFTVKMDELKGYVNGGGLHIFNYLMSSLPDDLIAYTNDTATHTSYPVLTQEYTTGQTIAQYIVSKLV